MTKGGDTDLGINDKGNARKKVRKERKQIRREKRGDKREQEVTKAKSVLQATAAAIGANVSPASSPPVGVRKKSTNFSP